MVVPRNGHIATQRWSGPISRLTPCCTFRMVRLQHALSHVGIEVADKRGVVDVRPPSKPRSRSRRVRSGKAHRRPRTTRSTWCVRTCQILAHEGTPISDDKKLVVKLSEIALKRGQSTRRLSVRRQEPFLRQGSQDHLRDHRRGPKTDPIL
jgi:hypothetical protein